MIRSIILMFPALILFSGGTTLNPEEKVKVSQNFPPTIKAGDEFIVTLNLHKTAISGSARLQLYLPIGFNAEAIDNHGADFIFEDHSIKFVWFQMPAENDFTLSYKIKTEKNISGKQIVNGVFIFLEEEKTQRQPLPSSEINVRENSEKNVSGPAVIRNLIKIAPETGEYRVDLTFHPNNINESAKFTDEIPVNFTAEVIDAHEAAFSFENHSVIFNWKKLPSDSVFIISYKVRSGSADPSPVINGVLVYGDEINNNEQEAMKEVPSSEDFKTPGGEKSIEASSIDQDAPVADAKTIISEKQAMKSDASGIIFKVQVSATQRSSIKNNYWFDSRYHLNSQVELTYHEGWKKYLIGNFQAYADASALKIQTQQKISDAFVVAYQNGLRIPVHEALRNKSLNQ